MFKRSLIISSAVLSIGLFGCDDQAQESPSDQTSQLLQYVDPFIGTDGLGNVIPGAVVPEGMIQPSPDGAKEDGTPTDYHYSNDRITGFSNTHISGAGKGDMNDFAFMPYSGFNSGTASIDKTSEISVPGYYSAFLKETQITTELTATKRVAFHRYTFPENQEKKVKLDVGHELLGEWGNHTREITFKIIGDNAVAGMRVSNEWAQYQTVYFYAEFSQPFDSYLILNEGVQTTETEINSSRDVIAHFNFAAADDPQLQMKISISPLSIEGAQNNMAAESSAFEFDLVREQASKAWGEVLEKFQLKGGTDAEKTMFYTSLYHTYFAPFVYQDSDGQYRGMDGKAYQAAEGFTNYSVYSMWDTFRAAHPLKTILDKQRSVEYVHDLLNKYKTGGVLPKWELHSDYTGEMVGYPAVSVIADTMIKYPDAFSQQDFELAMQAAEVSANFDMSITDDWIPYQDSWNGDKRWIVMTRHGEYQEELGYVPADIKDNPADVYDTIVNESVSYGLENAYYDWCIAQIARLAGDTVQEARYLERSKAFKNYFDYNPAEYGQYSSTGFMRPKNLDGSWVNNMSSCEGDDCEGEPNDYFWPYKAEHRGENFTEGNTWQWTWFAPHDINGLKEVMGGEQSFLANLNALFNADSDADTSQGDMTGYIGQYVHGNEPDHHVIYLYNYTSEPWKTQEYLDQVMDNFYLPTPEGLIGNEDVGQMSAWYIMSAMGFYQISPAEPVYTIGRPLFDVMEVTIDGGTFTITAENNSPDNIYVESVTINGKKLDANNTFNHNEIYPGGQLRFVMSSSKPAL
ncbi:GH92 family glycosyl hydrolase [Psychromonas aquimarina]|uniref:GH92 family glycosyl hydrolase n=1 Tax=Psychromonas aquimarina TaxID=444919 RepID=UPI000415503C|nr:GH92 family glycosyl hydrolase [Psychromonas aquimarina]